VTAAVKNLALLFGCLLVLSCSGGGASSGQGGHGGGQAGAAGSAGNGGATGSGGTGGGGNFGQAGSTGSGGSAGQAGTTGGAAGTSGAGGHGGASTGGAGGSGPGGQQGGATGSAGHGGAGHGGGTGGGGRGGGGGGAGTVGQGGAGGNEQTCNQFQVAYSAAYLRARTCHANLSVAQCTHLVVISLSCGCQGWVNDTTELDQIHAQFTAAGCTSKVCPIACPAPGARGGCAVADSGDICTSVFTTTN